METATEFAGASILCARADLDNAQSSTGTMGETNVRSKIKA